ncbi:Rhomboid protease GluP [bacterium HR39]|nr:Rhomboid protease GluP [bacterium HR39]
MIPIRDENPTRRRPVVTIGLIGLCVLVFLWQIGGGPRAFERGVYAFGLVPAALTGHARLSPRLAVLPPELTLFTHMFLHGGWLHLGGNMLYLWIFGNNVEDRLGHLRFCGFYLACGVAAALAHVAIDPASRIPMVGASGAISGVLAAYLVWFPNARVLVLVPAGFLFTTLLPAWLLIAVWFLLQIANALLADPSAPGVAWWAHVGGFVAGLALALPARVREARRPPRRRGPWE